MDDKADATLITLFLNAVMEIVRMSDERDAVTGMASLVSYMNIRCFNMPPPTGFPMAAVSQN